MLITYKSKRSRFLEEKSLLEKGIKIICITDDDENGCHKISIEGPKEVIKTLESKGTSLAKKLMEKEEGGFEEGSEDLSKEAASYDKWYYDHWDNPDLEKMEKLGLFKYAGYLGTIAYEIDKIFSKYLKPTQYKDTRSVGELYDMLPEEGKEELEAVRDKKIL